MAIDLDLFRTHTQGKSLVEVLLRGHLWVEKHLIGLIEAEVARPGLLELDRMSFRQKAKLAEALGMLSPQEAVLIGNLNRLRNRLAHDLEGVPVEGDIKALEKSAPRSQRSLASKLIPSLRHEGRRSDPDDELALRLTAIILAALTELEQHSQAHRYWRENRRAIEAYDLVVDIFERLGTTFPESPEEYRRAAGIPDPPTPADAVIGTRVTERATPGKRPEQGVDQSD